MRVRLLAHIAHGERVRIRLHFYQLSPYGNCLRLVRPLEVEG